MSPLECSLIDLDVRKLDGLRGRRKVFRVRLGDSALCTETGLTADDAESADGSTFCPRAQSKRSNREPRIRLGKHVPFLPSLLGIRATELRVGELLSELDARLIERIHTVHLAGVNRRDLEEHEERADVPCVSLLDMDRHVGAPASGECACRRALLDVQ